MMTMRLTMKLSDINLHDIGNTIQITGCIYSDKENHFLCFFPNEDPEGNFIHLEMDKADWEKFLRQTDILETEILAKAKDKTITKAIVRKAERQISSNVQWTVFRRDGYACRYCAADDVPLTLDHLVLWEEGGPSIEKNLITACKKCNRNRGNMQLGEWLQSEAFRSRSAKLSHWARKDLVDLLEMLPSITRNIQVRSR
jgi:5-methylcytosine-specific restriction endonuclease McrA